MVPRAGRFRTGWFSPRSARHRRIVLGRFGAVEHAVIALDFTHAITVGWRADAAVFGDLQSGGEVRCGKEVGELTGAIDAHETFESINRAGEFAHLFTAPNLPTALEITEHCRIGAPAYRFRVCEVERDYGMFDRAEAPQHYPPVPR